jgi:hypothetical protein
MKSKEFLVVIMLALFLGTGMGIKYLLGTAEEITTETQEDLGNLVLTNHGGNLFSLTGDVGIGDCERIVPQLPTTEPFTLILESPGGSLGDGICLAANLKIRNVITVIRDTPVSNENGEVTYDPGMNTTVGKQMSLTQGKPMVMCASACSLLFLAGDERYLIGDVYLGIHAPRSAGAVPSAAIAEAGAYQTANQLLTFLEFQLEVDSAELRRLFISVPANTMYYVNPKDFNRAQYLVGIATHYIDFHGFNFIDPHASVYEAQSKQGEEIRRMNEAQRR